jgi:hypothetical protein
VSIRPHASDERNGQRSLPVQARVRIIGAMLRRCWMYLAVAMLLAGCGEVAVRPDPSPIEATAVTTVAADPADLQRQDELMTRLTTDERCRCWFDLADLAGEPVMRNGQLEIHLNPRTVVQLTFPSSKEDALRVTAAMLVVAFDMSEGIPKVRALRLLGAPAAIRDAKGQAMVISPRIALGIGDGGIMSVDIDPRGIISRIPGA